MDNTDTIKPSIRDTVADKTAKRVEKQQRDKEAREQRAAGEFINKLIIDRQPDGLYFVRWSEGGALPELLQTKFTSIRKIEDIIKLKYGSLEIIHKG